MQVIGLFLFSFLAFGNDCVQIRAAFDIGSGSTRMKVAKVNICQQKIIKYLANVKRKNSFKESLKLTGRFNKKSMDDGLETISKFVELAKKHRPHSIDGVAAEAFRQSSNGHEYINKINKKLGINIQIIKQELEARLGFFAATRLSNQPMDDVVVWDVGGGSMQISTLDKGNNLSVYKGKLGSIEFKNRIIRQVQNKDLTAFDHPNPISLYEMALASDISQLESNRVPFLIKDKIKKSKTVIGIAGIHCASIKSQVNNGKAFYTYDELYRTMIGKAGHRDDKSKNPFYATDTSNLALIHGFMKGLHIQKVILVDVNLADGVLLSPRNLLFKKVATK